MLKGLNDFMDKHEGREVGSSTKAIMKERKRQGYDGGHKAKSKALASKMGGHIEGGGGRKIDVYHNGKYAHSTNMSRTLKHARETSRLEGGKVHAEYSK